MTRTRTVTWDDPDITVQQLRRLPGLEFLRRMMAGEFPLPPMARVMDLRLTEVERGRVVFEATPQESHYNLLGAIHGGMAATILDSAMGCSVNSYLEAGDLYTTLELKVNYLRAMTRDTGTVRAVATVVHIGRTTALAEGRLFDAEDRIYAFASSTCLIKRATAAT